MLGAVHLCERLCVGLRLTERLHLFLSTCVLRQGLSLNLELMLG